MSRPLAALVPMMSAAEAKAARAAQAVQPMTAGGQFFRTAIDEGADGLYDPPGDNWATVMRRAVLIGVALLAVGIADARPRFLCRDGNPDRARIRGMKTDGRSYPFCTRDQSRDGFRLFSFCPDMAYVVGCNLDPRCQGPVIECSDPGWEDATAGESFTVERGRSQLVEKRVDGRAVRFTLQCR